MTHQIYHIKLMNTEEILAELMPSTNKDEYRIKNPLLIQDVVDPSSGVSAIVLVDYVPFTDNKDDVFINKSMVISKMKVGVAMMNYYRASLDYSITVGNADVLFKIQAAADRLSKYMLERNNVSEGRVIPIKFEDDLAEEDLEEMDLEEIFGSTEPTANTTIH